MNISNQKSGLLFATIVILAGFLTILSNTQQAEAANPYIKNVFFGQDEQGDYISFDWVGIPPNQQEGGWFGCTRDMILVWFNRFNPNGTTEGMRLPPEGMSNYPTGDFIPRNAFYSGGGYSGFGNYAFASGLPDYSCTTNDPNLSEKLPAHIKTYINPNWSPERLSFSGKDFITIQLVGYKMNLGYAEMLVHDPEEYRYQVPANPLPVIPYTNVSFGFDENDLLKISFDWIGPSRDILPLVGFNGKVSDPWYAHFNPDPEKDVSMNWEDGHNENLFNVNWFTGGFTAQKGEHYNLFVQELHKWTPSNELRVCNWFYPCPVNRTLTEAVLGRSFNLDDYITIAFHSSGYVLNDPSKYYFGQQNNSPILSYSQEAGYIDDGINPDEGDPETSFTFKIIYSDADNDPPSDIRVVATDGTLSDSPAEEILNNEMILDSSASPELRDGNYTNGEQYTLSRTFPTGQYRYHFQASDGGETSVVFFGIAGGKEQIFTVKNEPVFLLGGPWPNHCNDSFTAIAVHPRDGTILYIGSSDIEEGCGIYKTTDGGKTWISANAGLPDGLPFDTHYPPISKIVISPSDPNILYAGTAFPLPPFPGGSVFRSHDGGLHWEERGGTAGIFGVSRDIILPVMDLAIDPQNPDTVYAGLAGNGVYKTTDGGLDWKEIKTGNQIVYSSIVRVDALQPNTIYISQTTSFNGNIPLCGFGYAEKGCVKSSSQSSLLYKSTDGGSKKSWDALILVKHCAPKCLVNHTDLALDPFVSGTLYLATKSAFVTSLLLSPNRGILKSIDGGANWQQINNAGELDLSDFIITKVVADPLVSNRLFAVGFKNSTYTIFYSLNGGQNWESLKPNGLPELIIKNLYLNHNKNLLYLPSDRGIYVVDLAQVVTRSLRSSEAERQFPSK